MSNMPYLNKKDKANNHKRYMKEVWYPRNKKKHIGYIENIKKKITDYILNFKRNSKCLDCGFKGDNYPQVLDFDHVIGSKKFNISEFRLHTSGFNKVKKEINKCEIVCANCHRIRTARRAKFQH
jgi:5-methylcytosine-specific restriction endonuclease McrA